VLDELGVERLELLRVPGRDFEDADETVPRDQWDAEHRRFPDVVCRLVTAVVVEHGRQRAGRLVPPLAPGVVLSIEAVHAFRLEQRRRRVTDRYPQTDPLALRLGPRDLFRHYAQRRLVFLANEQRRRMIVEREGTDAVQDLVEEILGMDLLHDLPVDPVTNTQQSIAVDPVNGGRQDCCDASDQPSILVIEDASGRRQGNRAPRAASPPDRSEQHVALYRRVGVTDVPGQDAQVPIRPLRQAEQQVGFDAARSQRRDTSMRRPEQLAGVPERMPQRLVRLTHVFQVR
jgi:hypothetical protein